MNRYFMEVAYKGAPYAGFQVQENAVTIQSEIQQALEVYFRRQVLLTGSSRTDAGVHALQNYFHFDLEMAFPQRAVYNLNAMLGKDIVIRRVVPVAGDAHCRFMATSREYRYYVYRDKNPFYYDRAYYFPYTLDLGLMRQAASVLMEYRDFSSFSKRNTQVRSFECTMRVSEWLEEDGLWVYRVEANRFLRGMVRGLVGTMLQVGRGKLSLEGFRAIVESRSIAQTNFAVPGQGLFLVRVNFPERVLGVADR